MANDDKEPKDSEEYVLVPIKICEPQSMNGSLSINLANSRQSKDQPQIYLFSVREG